MDTKKQAVHDFWNQASCGEELYLSGTDKANYIDQAKSRYKLEGQMIFRLAQFTKAKGLKVLEVGVGLGADHQQFAEAVARTRRHGSGRDRVLGSGASCSLNPGVAWGTHHSRKRSFPSIY